GLEQNQVVGQSAFDIYKDYPEITNAIKKALAGQPADFESNIGDASFMNYVVPYSFVQGKIFGLVGVALDVTERKKIELELKINEQRLTSIFKMVGDSIFLLEVENENTYRFVSVNDMFLKTTGLPLESIVGQYVHQVIPEPSLVLVLNRYQQAIAEKTIVRWEETTHYPTGTLTGEVSISPVFDENNRCTYLVGAVHDVTERKHAEEALRESQERYRKSFEDHSAVKIILDPDTGAIFDVNNAAAEYYGWSREVLKTMTIHQINTLSQEQINNRMSDALTNIQNQFEFRHRRADGSIRDVEVFSSRIKIKGKSVLDSIVHDITERKHAEEELRTSHAFNEMLLQAIPFGMDIVDEDGTILFFSNTMKNNLKTDGTGQTCWAVYKDDKSQCLDCPLRKGIEIGRSETVEVTNIFTNRTFQINHVGIMYQEKKAMLEVFVDVTEQRKLQNQFLQSQKIQSIGTLAGGIAHDFNNILGIIIAYSSLLERGAENKKKIVECSTAINKAVDRGAALVRQILTFARQSDVAFRPMSVPDLVHEIISMLNETFPKVIEIRCTIEEKISLVNADHSQMHQALLNLCVNARDAMPKGGILSINVEMVEQKIVQARFSSASNEFYVSISVSDTGTGIDAKNKLQIFDPFFTTKEKGKGTGLGLSVVYGVMQTHHGFVDLESEVGKGTTFVLYLPIPQTTDVIQKQMPQTFTEIASGTETILLVEDEADLRNYLQTILISKGYHVLTAVDGIDAIAKYAEYKNEIALVLSDVGLPKMTGVEEFLKLHEINPRVNVILASGFLELETKTKLFQLGIREFIQKPYNSFEVLTEIRKILDSPNPVP
ncbi:MAG TPA: PAS domain S-box protein, partial [Bacteroidota bacterium]|nr:PAS domain S-box protein [Bacteroidota bacterium]